MSWLVQYRATSGQQMTTEHASRQEAFSTLADSLFACVLLLWDSGNPRAEESGDRLMRHAVRLAAEAEQDDDGDGYLLTLPQGRRWLVTAV